MKTGFITLLIFFTILSPVSASDSTGSVAAERIYLHTDRKIYIAGEYLFYTLYLQGEGNRTSKYAYLVLRDQNNSVLSNVRLEIINQTSYGSIFLPDTLSSGFYQIVCYTNLMRNSGENYFEKEIVIANRFDETLNQFTGKSAKNEPEKSAIERSGGAITDDNIIIIPDKLVYNPREKISFSVETKNISKEEITSLSISVSELVPGIPAEPSVSDWFKNRTDVPAVMESNLNVDKYEPEFNGAVLQGRVISPSAVNNFTVFLSTIDTVVNLQYAKTESNGSFSFKLNPYYEGKELVVKLREESNATIELDRKTSLKQSYEPLKESDVPGLKESLFRSGKIVQIQRYYNKKVLIDTQKVFLPAKTIPRVYYKSYTTVLPSDYLELKDFVEISREILPALKIRKKDDVYVSDYPNLQYRSDSKDEPLIFLDGVPIDDVNQIIRLGTTEIKSIVTVPAIRYYGNMSYRGILAVFSRKLVINDIIYKTPAIKYQALASQAFTKPKPFNPENIARNHPDLRQVLLWEPVFIFSGNNKSQVECYASDLAGKYLINIQGITSAGNPLTGSAVILIKEK